MGSQLAKNLFTEIITAHPEKPWLDINANELTDDFLKIESKNWDSVMWESYLKTLEYPIRESLVSEKCFSLALDNGQSVFDLVLEETDNKSEIPLGKYLENLSPRQASVIKLSLEKNLSERKIASVLSVSRSTVKTAKKRGMQKLKHLIGS